MRNRQEEIRSKGFKMMSRRRGFEIDSSPVNGLIDRASHEFGKMKVHEKTLKDASLNLNLYADVDSTYGDKTRVLQALANNDYESLRMISNLFFNTSGIYARVCKYLAYLFRFDSMIFPVIMDYDTVDNDEVMKTFHSTLRYLDKSCLKKLFGSIALKVIINGCYCGYITTNKTQLAIQELPIEFCRSRFERNGRPALEFDMSYFDKTFRDEAYRARILNMYPKEFAKGYALYKAGKLVAEYMGDTAGWYLLDPDLAFKINCNDSDAPMLCNAIPAIIDLGEAQEIDFKKTVQQLLKIIIQKLPIDKNGDLVFDVDEAKDIHENTVSMLSRCVGVDVMTTFADTDVANMSDSDSSTSVDDLAKVERSVYNEFGVSHNLFNSDSNLALSNSISNDEAAIVNILQQFERLLNFVIEKEFNSSEDYYFRFKILETTIHNYKDLSKLYKEQTQIGYSKMLPQIALGHPQSEIIAMANFENKVLGLTDIMIPPLMSSTMSSEQVLAQDVTGEGAGRPEKEDSEKSDKTIANKESI